MADLLNFKTTDASAAQVNVPRTLIEGKFVDSDDQSIVLADLTGDSAFQFPGDLVSLTPEQRQEVVSQIANLLLQMKAGLS